MNIKGEITEKPIQNLLYGVFQGGDDYRYPINKTTALEVQKIRISGKIFEVHPRIKKTRILKCNK